MLEPIRHILSQQRIVLASGSPRRFDILKMIGLNFEVEASKFEENLDKNSFSHPCEYVKENAKQKAIEVWNRLSNSKASSSNNRPDLVIGADTVVTLYDEILEKPKDEEDAFDMLKKLSGLKHTVFTGVALVTKTKQVPQLQKHQANSQPSSLESHDLDDRAATGARSLQNQVSFQQLIRQNSGDIKDYLVTTFHESTDVTMAELNNDIIKAYISTGEPFDKAGAYAIQCNGATLVEQIKGDYYNVVETLPIISYNKKQSSKKVLEQVKAPVHERKVFASLYRCARRALICISNETSASLLQVDISREEVIDGKIVWLIDKFGLLESSFVFRLT